MSAGPRIAIVEDDHSLRLALVNLMRSYGYDAVGFGTAEAFLSSGTPKTSACVVTDIHLPGMDGFDLKSHLAGRGIATPVIMITGRPEPELETKAMSSGAADFFRKPLEHGKLVASVEQAVRAKG